MPCSETRHKHRGDLPWREAVSLLDSSTPRAAAPRMAVHRAQIHAGAVPFRPSNPPRTGQEGREAVRRFPPLPAMRGTGAAQGVPCPPSRLNMGNGGGAHAGRLHAQDSGSEDGNTPGTDPLQGGYSPCPFRPPGRHGNADPNGQPRQASPRGPGVGRRPVLCPLFLPAMRGPWTAP